MPTGVTTIDFGAAPGAHNATKTIAGQSAIVAGSPGTCSFVEAWLDYSASTDHTDDEHLISGIEIVCGNIVAGVGFDINAYTDRGPLTGQYNVNWIWI